MVLNTIFHHPSTLTGSDWDLLGKHNTQLKLKQNLRGTRERTPTMQNSTYNNSSDDVPCSNAASIFFTTAMALLSLAAVIGNILVFVAVYRTPSLRTSTNYYYVNMSVSDFMSTITTWPLYLTDEIITSRGSLIQGRLATTACQAGVFVRNISHSVSLLSLTLIAVDRYIATVFPLRATRLTKKIRGVLLLSIWIIVILCCFPSMYYSKVETIGHETYCILALKASSIAVYYTFCLILIVALLIAIIILYSRIMRILKSRLDPGSGQESTTAERNRNQNNQNVMKIFGSIVVVFIVCWFPFFIYLILKMTFPELFTRDKCKLILGFAYYVFPMLSTVINPIILFSFSSNYHWALKALFSFSCSEHMPFSEVKKVVPYRENDYQPQPVTFKMLEKSGED